jgi:hypothetical protein
MSLCFSGLDTPCGVQTVTIDVSPADPLIQLAQGIPWQTLADIVLPDLKRTTAQGKWWPGRKLSCTRVLLRHPYAGATDSPHPRQRSLITSHDTYTCIY